MACMEKLNVMNSQIGRSPAYNINRLNTSSSKCLSMSQTNCIAVIDSYSQTEQADKTNDITTFLSNQPSPTDSAAYSVLTNI